MRQEWIDGELFELSEREAKIFDSGWAEGESAANEKWRDRVADAGSDSFEDGFDRGYKEGYADHEEEISSVLSKTFLFRISKVLDPACDPITDLSYDPFLNLWSVTSPFSGRKVTF